MAERGARRGAELTALIERLRHLEDISRITDPKIAIHSNSPIDRKKTHSIADEVLLEALDKLGQSELATAFREVRERIGFWYA